MAVKKIRINEAEEVINLGVIAPEYIDNIDEAVEERKIVIDNYLDIYNNFTYELHTYTERLSNVRLDITVNDNEYLVDTFDDKRDKWFQRDKFKNVRNKYNRKFSDYYINIVEVPELKNISVINEVYSLIKKFESELSRFSYSIASLAINVKDSYFRYLDDIFNGAKNPTIFIDRVNTEKINKYISNCESLSSEIDNALNQLGV
jgi:hypothetical protein